MARAVSADHVLFKECILNFRNDNSLRVGKNNEESNLVGYVMLDFQLTETIDLGDFKINPTIRVDFPNAYAAFIAPVILPKWCERHNSHLFTIALSTIISFITGRASKSTRDFYLCGRQLNQDELTTLGLQFPILVAGPGSHDTILSKETTLNYIKELKTITQILFSISYDDYFIIMQSIRLVYLAHLSKRDDFALAYYLLVSSMESVAQVAIRRKSVAEKHPLEDRWNVLAKTNEEFSQILSAYKQERGKNSYLSKRFNKFIMTYCPPDKWNQLEHPEENRVSYLSEITGADNFSWLTKKQWYELYPEDLSSKMLEEVIANTYKYRSKFTHEGQSPPHNDPRSSNKFFDQQYEFDEDNCKSTSLILANYRLIAFISKYSIYEYTKSLL